MKVLISHPSFASQYEHIVKALCNEPQNQVTFLCGNYRGQFKHPNLNLIPYRINTEELELNCIKTIKEFETHCHHGIAAGKALTNYKDKHNYKPDVILGHPGWGNLLFIRDIYPDTPLLAYPEFFSSYSSNNAFFDPLKKLEYSLMNYNRMYNSAYLHAMKDANWLICPTHWQGSRIPKSFQSKLSVLHDGIDTDLITPAKNIKIKLSSGLEFSSDDEIITYVARGFETARGFPTVMAALPHILKERPNAHVLMIGSDKASYGKAPTENDSWKSLMQKYVTYDQKRVHWLGKLDFSVYVKLLNLSSVHIYLSKPFVLSWSLTEAMAAGCNIVASATPPLLEIIKDGENGLLVDFYSAENLARTVCKVLSNKEEMSYLGQNARKTIEDKFSLKKTIPLHLELIKQLADGQEKPQISETISKFYPKIENFYNMPHYFDF